MTLFLRDQILDGRGRKEDGTKEEVNYETDLAKLWPTWQGAWNKSYPSELSNIGSRY